MRLGRWAAATVLILTGCVGADGEGPAGASDAATTDDETGGASGVLTLDCTDEGIEVGARRVVAQPDGVHIDVRFLPDDGTTVELASVSAGRGEIHGGSLGGAYEIGADVIDTVAPGEVLVRCYPDSGPRHFQSAEEDAESLVIDVVDPNDYWTPLPDLDCAGPVANATYDYAEAPRNDTDGPIQPLADRAVTDLGQPAKDIETFGFRDGRHRWAGVPEQGTIVKIASYVADGETWRITSMTGCDGI